MEVSDPLTCAELLRCHLPAVCWTPLEFFPRKLGNWIYPNNNKYNNIKDYKTMGTPSSTASSLGHCQILKEEGPTPHRVRGLSRLRESVYCSGGGGGNHRVFGYSMTRKKDIRTGKNLPTSAAVLLVLGCSGGVNLTCAPAFALCRGAGFFFWSMFSRTPAAQYVYPGAKGRTADLYFLPAIYSNGLIASQAWANRRHTFAEPPPHKTPPQLHPAPPTPLGGELTAIY